MQIIKSTEMTKELRYTDKDYEKIMQAFTENEQDGNLLDRGDDEYEQCFKTWIILKEMKNIEEFDTDKAWNKLHNTFVAEQLIANNRSKVLSIKRLIAVAASIIIVLGVVFFYQQNLVENNVVVQNNSTVIKEVILPDGSLATLNKNASITYPRVFGKTNREVALAGEAFFNVEPNTEKPFIIRLNKANIKVLGTSFNVNELDNNTIEVTVNSGKVEFSDDKSKNTVTLTKGEKGFLGKKGIAKTVNDNENFIAWINKKLIFKSTPLHIVVRDINAAYHSNIVLASNDIGSMMITTTFDSLSVDEVLQSIALTLNISIEQQEENTILVRH